MATTVVQRALFAADSFHGGAATFYLGFSTFKQEEELLDHHFFFFLIMLYDSDRGVSHGTQRQQWQQAPQIPNKDSSN